MLQYKEFNSGLLNEIKEIYKEQDWTAYLQDDEKLMRAFENSLYLYGAFDENKLIGFVRCVGDGEHILLIQDLIVKSAYQRQGIGTILLRHIFEKYAGVRMLSLYTDGSDERANNFYRNIGMKLVEEYQTVSYMR
ncbi:MAG: GNAT family N-acetyltransferase [Lachnospiraceae bacterium]|nr:GNAT family N-acetyltransferase [Lachnospiraceae bacterium]